RARPLSVLRYQGVGRADDQEVGQPALGNVDLDQRAVHPRHRAGRYLEQKTGGRCPMRTVLDEQYVTVPEAARLVGVHPASIRRWIDSGRLPAHRVGQRRVLIKRVDLAKLITPARAEQEKGGAMSRAESLRVPPLSREEQHELLQEVDCSAATARASDCFSTRTDRRARRERPSPRRPTVALNTARDTRRATNPLFNDNRMKLGVFGANVSNGCAITMAEGRLETTWPNTRTVATLADQAGLEAMVPVARWKGFGGPTNFNGTCFETYTWAAGLAAITDHAAIFSTSHVPTVHPIMAAKQATTIDHISGGRFALNVVCGWYQPELEMFGAPIMEHDTRYEYAEEWLEVIRRLWTEEEEFEYEGRFFRIQKGFHQPKPIQRPFPPIMNAGGSPTGQRFAAKHADMAFILVREHDYDGARAQVQHLRRLAREEFGRALQVWCSAYVVCRPTEREA